MTVNGISRSQRRAWAAVSVAVFACALVSAPLISCPHHEGHVPIPDEATTPVAMGHGMAHEATDEHSSAPEHAPCSCLDACGTGSDTQPVVMTDASAASHLAPPTDRVPEASEVSPRARPPHILPFPNPPPLIA